MLQRKAGHAVPINEGPEGFAERPMPAGVQGVRERVWGAGPGRQGHDIGAFRRDIGARRRKCRAQVAGLFHRGRRESPVLAQDARAELTDAVALAGFDVLDGDDARVLDAAPGDDPAGMQAVEDFVKRVVPVQDAVLIDAAPNLGA